MTTIYNMLRVYTRELVLEDGCTEMHQDKLWRRWGTWPGASNRGRSGTCRSAACPGSRLSCTTRSTRPTASRLVRGSGLPCLCRCRCRCRSSRLSPSCYRRSRRRSSRPPMHGGGASHECKYANVWLTCIAPVSPCSVKQSKHGQMYPSTCDMPPAHALAMVGTEFSSGFPYECCARTITNCLL